MSALPIGGPATSSWRESALTRVAELRALTTSMTASGADRNGAAWKRPLLASITQHLETAQAAAEGSSRGGGRRWLRSLTGAEVERVRSNVDAAEVDLLRLAPIGYVAGQLPTLLAHARQHLQRGDPRLIQLEEIAREAATGHPDESDREAIVAAAYATSRAARDEVRRVRSFRNTLLSVIALLTAAAVAVVLVGALEPHVMPLCYTPENKVVCPTQQAGPVPAGQDADDLIRETATGWDYPVVALLGLVAGALAAAAAIRGIRGTSTPYSLPAVTALLKLPAGALTAVLGLLAIGGGFVPGLSALDTPGQILAWAIGFGYAQQLLSRLVDRRAQSVLDDVGGSTATSAAPERT